MNDGVLFFLVWLLLIAVSGFIAFLLMWNEERKERKKDEEKLKEHYVVKQFVSKIDDIVRIRNLQLISLLSDYHDFLKKNEMNKKEDNSNGR